MGGKAFCKRRASSRQSQKIEDAQRTARATDYAEFRAYGIQGSQMELEKLYLDLLKDGKWIVHDALVTSQRG